MPPVEVKDAPFGYALPAPLPGNRVTGYDLVRGKEDGPNGRHLRVTTGTSKFEYHYLTRSKLGPDSVMGAPHLRGYVSRKFGSLSSFATGYLGYIFDPENPDQEYDIYVCLKFGKEQMYTSHLLFLWLIWIPYIMFIIIFPSMKSSVQKIFRLCALMIFPGQP